MGDSRICRAVFLEQMVALLALALALSLCFVTMLEIDVLEVQNRPSRCIVGLLLRHTREPTMFMGKAEKVIV